ncbi:LTA synthase family protein [Paenibacillus sp. S150]|uniref:LTA synthase family protein n=1 Tax=Paenibacillus sp. S150 TaxID=2749826 RepID=UPI001C565E9D|nr:LTA synthase family protein [Paenibacillus sp. S150]MBW4083415.1 LTA synthase family protein [Paenibacillus sp. S150]
MRYFQPSKRLGFLLLGLLLGGFVLNFFIQAASLNMNFISVLDWIGKSCWLYLGGSLLFFFVLLALSAVLPNIYIGPAVGFVLVLLLGLANYKKQGTTGEPLFPWDLMLVKNAGEMSKITKGMISPLAVGLAVPAVAAGVWLLLKLPKIRIRLPLRLLLTAVSAGMVAGFIIMVSRQTAFASSLNYQNIFWNQKVNYSQNGFVFAFTGNLRQKLLEKPEGYSREAVEAVAAKYSALPDNSSAQSAAEQPNILFMMDEAFFDPTRLPGLQLSEDPLKFIRREEGATPAGFLLSPEFGGNTANVEFEALTGMSMYFLGDGSIPYQQRLVKMSSLPSIVSILKAKGYLTLAVHPFDETFYNRNRVYPVLGFDRFTSEKDLQDAERITPDGYISDKAAVQEAVRELKAAAVPVFVHLVTMQNHFPFTKGLNGPNTIAVQGVQAAWKDELETYVQNTKLTDEALSYLQQELKTLERPTIAVFWGDHLPALSAGIYTEAGWDENPRLKHETKLMILANFDIGNEPLGTISPAYLGPTVFKLSGQTLPPFYKMLEQVQAQLPGLSKNVLIGASGEPASLTSGQQELLADYRMVEYDLLEGEGYAEGLMY